MTSQVAGNAWGEIVHHRSDGVLELRWLPGAMTDGAFKATLALLAWEAEKLRPSFLLIDATQFDHQPGPDVMRWRDDCIIPRYGAAGVTKFAFMPAGFPNTMENGAKGEGPEAARFALQPLDVVLVTESGVARAGRTVDQYVRQMIPLSLTGGFSWLLGGVPGVR